MNNLKIGFIGMGWIGHNMSDNFKERGYDIVRYSLEEPYVKNKDKIKDCDIVFLSLPTPSTPSGFDDSIIRKAIKNVGKGKIAVIKSTILPGTTESIQLENSNIYVFHSPEFLTEATAAHDTANPDRNIIGVPLLCDVDRKKAKEVMEVLPFAPYQLICHSKEAEFIKYGGNCWFYFKVIFINMLYDMVKNKNCQWEVIRDAMAADHRIGRTHLDPVHKSGRGAGGHCFIKDFAAFANLYKELVGDEAGLDILQNIQEKNVDLLIDSKKDLDLLAGVYGEDILNHK